MKKILIILTFLASLLTALYGQNKTSFLKMENETYAFFVQKQWDSLIQKSKIAKQQNMQSYTLDLRFGAAYYHKKRYRKALQYFENLDLSQSQDLLLMEYRYYAYLFSGRFVDARKLCVDYQNLAEKSDFCSGDAFGMTGVESKHYFFPQKLPEEENIDSIQTSTKQRDYYAFYFDFQPLKNWKFTLAPMWMKEENQYRNRDWEISGWEEKVNQNHLYLSTQYLLGYGKRFWLNDHYILTNSIAIPEDTLTDLYSEGKNEKHIFGFFYQQNAGNLDFTAGVNYSPQDTAGMFYPSIGITWYPWGNDRLYFYTNVMYQAQRQSKPNPLIIKHKIGLKLIKNLWAEPFGMYGSTQNYYDDNGYVIYSQQNSMKYYYGINLQF
jgi:hypothetical protein